MKLISLLMLLLGSLVCQAQTPTVDLGYQARYLSGDTGAIVSSTPFTTTNIRLSSGGNYFNLWHASDAAGRPGYNNETDYSFGRKVLPWLTLEASYFDIFGSGDFYAARATAERGQVYAMVLDLIPTKPSTLKGGLCYRVGLKVPSRSSLSTDLSLAGNQGLFGHQAEPVSSVRLKLSWVLGKHSPLTAYAVGQYSLGNTGFTNKQVFNAGITWQVAH